MATIPLHGVRLDLVCQRDTPVRHPVAVGQPVVLAAVPYAGTAIEPFTQHSGADGDSQFVMLFDGKT